MKARPIAAAIGSSVAADGDDRHRPDPAMGVFETLLVRGGEVQALERHLQRLGSAVAELYGKSVCTDLADRVRARAASLSGEHRLRVRAVPGGRDVAVEIECEPLLLPDPSAGLTLKPLLVPGGLGAYKWCDRRLLDHHGDGSSVPLIIDCGDEVLEAAWANVWIVEGRRIVTPPADGRLLPGVTRGLLLEYAPGLGLTAAAERISLARAQRADAIFLTSSLRHAVGAGLADGTAAVRGEARGDSGARTDVDSIVPMIRKALSKS